MNAGRGKPRMGNPVETGPLASFPSGVWPRQPHVGPWVWSFPEGRGWSLSPSDCRESCPFKALWVISHYLCVPLYLLEWIYPLLPSCSPG